MAHTSGLKLVIASRPEAPVTRTDQQGNAVRNILLLALSNETFGPLASELEWVEFPTGKSLQEPGEPIEWAYFLNGGLCSLIVVMSDGETVEIGVLGTEGILGANLAVGLNRSPHRAIVQMGADGFRLRAESLRRLVSSNAELAMSINRFAQIQGLLIAQTAACNRLHEVEQRMSRWLLVSQDRVGSQVLCMTHEFLARMLGTGRPSVSIAAGILQRARLIDYHRGKLKILDRRGLEEAACQCYANMRRFNADLGLI